MCTMLAATDVDELSTADGQRDYHLWLFERALEPDWIMDFLLIYPALVRMRPEGRESDPYPTVGMGEIPW